MKTIYIFLALLCLACLPAHSQMDKPLRSPAFLGGIDSASKNFIRQENANRHKSKVYEDQDRLQGTLIEDPRVIFSTYLGGNGYDCGNSLSVTQDSGVYVVGYTGSTNFPVSDDAVQKAKKGGHDMFVGKFTKTGERVWLTYLGGNGTDVATECVTDKDDNLILVGKTNSVDFPKSGGTEQDSSAGNIDVVIVKFDPTGKIIWSRYYGGSSGEIGDGIALCANKFDFVITGSTLSDNVWGKKPLPVTPGCYQDSLAKLGAYYTSGSDAFVSKFSGDGKLVWGTYFGGSQTDAAHAVAVDKDDNIAIVGETKYGGWIYAVPFPVTPDAFMKDTCALEDIFYAKFNSQGNLLYSTLYCGKSKKPGDEGPYPDPKDIAMDVKFDNKSNIIFCGYSFSKIFPTTTNAHKIHYDSRDAILVKFDNDNKLAYSTYFGGKDGDDIYQYSDFAHSISIDRENNIWVSGNTFCNDYTITPKDTITKYPIHGDDNNFITQFTNNGKIEYSTIYAWYLCEKIIVTKDYIYITGETGGNNFPVTKKAFQYNTGWGDTDGYLVNIKMPIIVDSVDTTDTNKKLTTYIYPSPVLNTLTITFPKTLKANICIYNLLGKHIYRDSLLEERKSLIIDVSRFSPGWYLLVIQMENQIEKKMFLKL